MIVAYPLGEVIQLARYQRIKDCREDKDLKQKEVAAILGIDQRVYSNYETERRKIPVDLLIKLAKLYGVSTDYLLGLEDKK